MRVRGLEEALRSLDPRTVAAAEERLLESLARLAASRASQYAPKRTGRLAASVSARRLGSMRLSVTPGVSYWPYVEFGVRPFRLGASVYVGGVGFRFVDVHPGIRPQRFLRRAASESLRDLRELVRSLLRERGV